MLFKGNEENLPVPCRFRFFSSRSANRYILFDITFSNRTPVPEISRIQPLTRTFRISGRVPAYRRIPGSPLLPEERPGNRKEAL